MIRSAAVCASLALLLVYGQDRRPDGGVWAQPNHDPRTLRQADVDAPMWPLVQTINHSGWVWTTESCWGHAGEYPLTLGIVTSDVGRAFALLGQAQRAVLSPDNARGESHDPHGTVINLQFWSGSKFPVLGSTQIRLIVVNPSNWEQGRRLFVQWADLLANKEQP